MSTVQSKEELTLLELAISGDFVRFMGDLGGKGALRFFDIEAAVLTCLHSLHTAMGTAHSDGDRYT